MKIANFVLENKVQVVHNFAATGQFKGIHDQAGKNTKHWIRKGERNSMKDFRCFSALRCFNVTRCGHHPKSHPDTPQYFFRRKRGQFDNYFYRLVCELVMSDMICIDNILLLSGTRQHLKVNTLYR